MAKTQSISINSATYCKYITLWRTYFSEVYYLFENIQYSDGTQIIERKHYISEEYGGILLVNYIFHQNRFLHKGQVEFWLVENHLYKHAEWNFFLQVGHATFGIWYVEPCKIKKQM